MNFYIAHEQGKETDPNVELFRSNEGRLAAKTRILRDHRFIHLEPEWQQPQFYFAQSDLSVQLPFELCLNEPAVLVHIHEQPHGYHCQQNHCGKDSKNKTDLSHQTSRLMLA